jgi:hypothetical protein
VVRVVDRREQSAVALAVTLAVTLVLGVLLFDDLALGGRLVPPLGTRAVEASVVGLLFALAAAGPWLRVRAHPRRVRVRIDVPQGWARLGRRTLHARAVARVSVVPAVRGFSVGILPHGGRALFVETDDLAIATSLARALGGAAAAAALPDGAPDPRLRFAAVLTTAVLGFAGAFDVATAASLASGGERRLGELAVFAPLAVLFATRALWKPSRGAAAPAFDEHLAIHAAASGASPPASPSSEMAEDAAVAGLAGLLGRRAEGVAAWIARLDAMPHEAGAYRGAALGRDALLAVASDESAAPDARAGAARLLAVRHGESPRALVRVVADPEVRLRVVAATASDPEEAAEELERLGPLYRARASVEDR